MSTTDDLLSAFEGHSVNDIRAALAAGADPVAPIDGKTPIQSLIEMYTRSNRFAECLRIMFAAGARIDDPLLEAILLDDAAQLESLLKTSPELLQRRFHLACTYTTLQGVSPLHVCAEYNSVHCARVLLSAGHDVNARADIDSSGIGGHTPIFHAVNSNQNHCRPVMEILVESGADLRLRVDLLVWGATFEWETVIFDASPISFAQCGLYFQFHRRESQVYDNLAYLYEKLHAAPAPIRNVPNHYLQDARLFPPRT